MFHSVSLPAILIHDKILIIPMLELKRRHPAVWLVGNTSGKNLYATHGKEGSLGFSIIRQYIMKCLCQNDLNGFVGKIVTVSARYTYFARERCCPSFGRSRAPC